MKDGELPFDESDLDDLVEELDLNEETFLSGVEILGAEKKADDAHVPKQRKNLNYDEVTLQNKPEFETEYRLEVWNQKDLAWEWFPTRNRWYRGKTIKEKFQIAKKENVRLKFRIARYKKWKFVESFEDLIAMEKREEELKFEEVQPEARRMWRSEGIDLEEVDRKKRELERAEIDRREHPAQKWSARWTKSNRPAKRPAKKSKKLDLNMEDFDV